MKKEIGGKTYVQVPAQVDGSCIGCAAQHDGGLCEKLHTGENGMFTPNICVLVDKIFKEQTMNDQKEKTALELVDELCGKLFTMIDGGRLLGYARNIKSAIERERDAMMADIQRLQAAISQNQAEFDRTIQDMNDRLESAIVMRPIAELPDKVPDGCVIVMITPRDAWLSLDAGTPLKDGAWEDYATHFYIIRYAPKPASRLHPCYMPGCGGDGKCVYDYSGSEDRSRKSWFVDCLKCHAQGPRCDSEQEAEQAWGYAE